MLFAKSGLCGVRGVVEQGKASHQGSCCRRHHKVDTSEQGWAFFTHSHFWEGALLLFVFVLSQAVTRLLACVTMIHHKTLQSIA
jgi:hypothetical protein